MRNAPPSGFWMWAELCNGCGGGGACVFPEETKQVLRLSLTEFSLPKFYLLFGISKVKSAAVIAFRSSYRDRSFSPGSYERETFALSSLETVTEALLEIMEVGGEETGSVGQRVPVKEADGVFVSSQACMRDIPACKWLDQWTELAQKYGPLNPAPPTTPDPAEELNMAASVTAGSPSSTTRPSSPELWWCSAASVRG